MCHPIYTCDSYTYCTVLTKFLIHYFWEWRFYLTYHERMIHWTLHKRKNIMYSEGNTLLYYRSFDSQWPSTKRAFDKWPPAFSVPSGGERIKPLLCVYWRGMLRPSAQFLKLFVWLQLPSGPTTWNWTISLDLSSPILQVNLRLVKKP